MKDRAALRLTLRQRLKQYEQARGTLPGIKSAENRSALVEQFIDSVRRVTFVSALRARDIASNRVSPQSNFFDPLRAALAFQMQGNLDEACWLTFLQTHTSHHRTDGWLLARQIYGGDGPDAIWTWQRVSTGVAQFRSWLEFRGEEWVAQRIAGRFGNHRRYESLSGRSAAGTGAVVESYVSWVSEFGSHSELLAAALAHPHESPSAGFEWLYQSMTAVHRFGRLSRFDFLCMLAKLGLASIEPGKPYLANSSGPLQGARALAGNKSVRELDLQMSEFGTALGVNMQVTEDALCNWHKSQSRYIRFRG